MKPVSPVLDPCPTLTEIDRSIDTGNFEPGHPSGGVSRSGLKG